MKKIAVPKNIETFLKNIWLVFVLRAIVLVIFGFVALFWPGLTLVTLLFIFAAYLVASGFLHIMAGAFSGTYRAGWIAELALGLIEILIAILIFQNPSISLSAFIIILGFMLLLIGFKEIFAGIAMQFLGGSRYLLILSGIGALLAGGITIMQPESGGIVFIWVVGVYAVVAGAMLLGLALAIRGNYYKIAKKRK